jgi:hypothetical protein
MIRLGGLVTLKPLKEAEEDKYVSIGFGKYKQKGKEKDPNSPTFKKDDSGKFVPTKGDTSTGGEPKKTTPKVNIFDKPVEEPKKDKKSADGTTKIKSEEDLQSQLNSLQGNPDAIGKFMETEIMAYYDPQREDITNEFIKREIETLRNPKASKAEKNKVLKNLKQVVSNMVNYNLEQGAEKRALKKGWPPRNDEPKNVADPSNMKSKEEITAKIDSLNGEALEDYVLKEIVPYLDKGDTRLLTTLFINLNGVSKDNSGYANIVKNLVKDTVKNFKTSTKSNTSSSDDMPGTSSGDYTDAYEKYADKMDGKTKQLYLSLVNDLEQAEQDIVDGEMDGDSDLEDTGYEAELAAQEKLDNLISKLKKQSNPTKESKSTRLTSILKEISYDPRAKRFLDAIQVSDRSIKDLKDITVDATPRGNWQVYHKGKVLTTINGKLLDDSTIMKYGLEYHG